MRELEKFAPNYLGLQQQWTNEPMISWQLSTNHEMIHKMFELDSLNTQFSETWLQWRLQNDRRRRQRWWRHQKWRPADGRRRRRRFPRQSCTSWSHLLILFLLHSSAKKWFPVSAATKTTKGNKNGLFHFFTKKKFLSPFALFRIFLSNDRMPVVRNRQSFTLPWRTIGRNGQIEILLLKATNFKMMIARFESWGWST